MRKVISIVLCFACGLSSCKSEFTYDELADHSRSEKSGMQQRAAVGDLKYTAQYRPSSLILATEELQGTEREDRMAVLEKMYWFNIDVELEGTDQSPLRYQLISLDEYNSRLDYFLNHAQRDIWIMNGSDTVFPVSYWFENNHNLVGKETMVLAFDKEQLTNDRPVISFNDRVFRTGIVKFPFSKKVLDKKIVLKDR